MESISAGFICTTPTTRLPIRFIRSHSTLTRTLAKMLAGDWCGKCKFEIARATTMNTYVCYDKACNVHIAHLTASVPRRARSTFQYRHGSHWTCTRHEQFTMVYLCAAHCSNWYNSQRSVWLSPSPTRCHCVLVSNVSMYWLYSIRRRFSASLFFFSFF